MQREVGVLALLGLLACGGPDVDRPDPEPDPEPTPVEAFVAGLDDDGYAVGEGLLWFSDYGSCCEPGANCLGNNPSTPYGTMAVPPAPGGTSPDYDLLGGWGLLPDPTVSRTFRLRPDEAVVWIGTLPPAARYASYRSYLLGRLDDDGLRPAMASLGRSLNQQVIAAERGVAVDEIWESSVAVVTSLDAAVEREIVDRLVAAGFEASTIHTDRIPGELVRAGLHEEADTFGAVVRVAVDADPEAGAAWRADPEAVVLRITPPEERPSLEPHPPDVLPPRGSGTSEEPWREALLALDEAIVGSMEGQQIVLPAAPVWQETLDCIDELYTCAGDIRDRYAAITPYLHLAGGDEVAVVWGVNHARTGKASYASFAVVTEEHEIGVVAVEDEEMVGTARHWLPDHPQADDLYAMVVARDCSGRVEPCLEVPTGCPGPELDERVRITVRAYLEPATGAAPVPDELLLDRVMKLSPD